MLSSTMRGLEAKLGDHDNGTRRGAQIVDSNATCASGAVAGTEALIGIRVGGTIDRGDRRSD